MRTIETGGHTEYTPVGHVTNLAARMQTAAPPGSIAASEATQRLCEGYFEFRALGPTAVKGLSAPVEVYEVTARRAAADALPARGAARADAVRRARARDWRQMKRALELAQERARADRRGSGEAGTGKSRLMLRVQGDTARTDAKCWRPTRSRTARRRPGCRCSNCCAAILAFRTRTIRPRDARKSVPRLPRSTRHSAKCCRICWGCSEYRKAPIRLPRWTRRSGAGARSKRSSGSYYARSLKHALVVIFEDLHWIDSETQALLDLLADSVAGARLLLLVNYRPEYRHEWSGKGHYLQLRLDPLGGENGAAMLTALLGGGVELEATQAADHRAHRGQSVLHRGDGAGAVRRGRVGTQRRSEG